MIRQVRFLIEILPLYFFMLISTVLSFDAKVKLGGYWFGFLVTHSAKLRNRIFANLNLVADTFNVEDREIFARQVGNSVGKALTELIYNKQFLESDNKIHLKTKLPTCLNSRQKNKKPIIFVSGHFGQWEAVRILLKKHGFECGAIYRKNKNPYFESIYLKCIKLGGEPIFPAGRAGTKRMIQHLKNGGILALLLDQAVSDGDNFIFFGKKAKTSMVIAELALKYDATIIPCYGIRGGDGISIGVVFEEPILKKEPPQIIQSINDSLEKQIRSSPTQWHWLHNRWKE